METIDKIEFVRHRVGSQRRHYIDEDDVKVVLSRLPDELYARLKRVLFKDDEKGRRVYGYTTTKGRRDISLCALPRRVSLSQVCTKDGHSPEVYGALRGSQWPTLAVRRNMLYNTLLHEVGHLQIILPKSSNPNRKYASEGKAHQDAFCALAGSNAPMGTASCIKDTPSIHRPISLHLWQPKRSPDEIPVAADSTKGKQPMQGPAQSDGATLLIRSSKNSV